MLPSDAGNPGFLVSAIALVLSFVLLFVFAGGVFWQGMGLMAGVEKPASYMGLGFGQIFPSQIWANGYGEKPTGMEKFRSANLAVRECIRFSVAILCGFMGWFCLGHTPAGVIQPGMGISIACGYAAVTLLLASLLIGGFGYLCPPFRRFLTHVDIVPLQPVVA